MKTLYIHIGTPKTATTAIQSFCDKNENALAQRDFCYPIFPYSYPNVGLQRNGHFLVGIYYEADGQANEQREQEIFREGLDTVKELFQKYDSIIVSDELIWQATHKRRATLWKELKHEAETEGYNVKVIVYLRRQDQFISSWWNQTVKMGMQPHSVTEWEQYIQKVPAVMQLNYYKKLRSISDVLGKENVMVRRFERDAFYGGSIYSDFLQAVGLSMDADFQVPEESVNDGLKGNTHEIKRILNTLSLDSSDNNFFRKVLTNCSEDSGEQYPSVMFSDEESLQFQNRYAKGNGKIAREFLNEPDGVLFDPTTSGKPKWEKDNNHMEEDIVRFVGEALICMRKEMEENQREAKRKEAVLKETIQKASKIQKTFSQKLMNSLCHPLRTIRYYFGRN